MKIDVSFEMVDDCVKFTINGKENVISIERLLALSTEPCRETDDYENEISDLHNRLDIAEYDKERFREKVTVLEEKLKALSAEPCEDCISREDAIANILVLFPDMPVVDIMGARRKWDEKYAQYNDCIQILREMPPVTPKPKTGHWIPVSERLPENHDDVLVWFEYIKNDYDCAWWGFAYYSLQYKKWVVSTNERNPIVKAWMPLPEPYEAEKE